MVKPVVCAMSGGVDSSVAAFLLREQGEEVIGVSMQVWDYRKNGGCDSKATCCSPDDFTDARVVASKIDIPYYVFDFENTFRERVIDQFVNTYKIGKTPNPCVECNNHVKFKELRERAEDLGAKSVATGHYARVKEVDGELSLLRGVDREKDQSYFLYGIKREELQNTDFPVGEMTKPEVREIARENGLPTAEKAESQDICFVSGKLEDFLANQGIRNRTGKIVQKDGTILGKHSGIHNYTVGQRRGIGVGGPGGALYVTEIRPESNEIVVGKKEELETSGLLVNQINWLSSQIDNLEEGEEFEAIAQLRHRHQGNRVFIKKLEDGSAQLRFIDEWTTVSPGQIAAIYGLDNQKLLGGGRILAPLV